MKKIIELIVTPALLTGVLSGCGGTPAGNGTTTSPEGSAPATQTEIK